MTDFSYRKQIAFYILVVALCFAIAVGAVFAAISFIDFDSAFAADDTVKLSAVEVTQNNGWVVTDATQGLNSAETWSKMFTVKVTYAQKNTVTADGTETVSWKNEDTVTLSYKSFSGASATAVTGEQVSFSFEGSNFKASVTPKSGAVADPDDASVTAIDASASFVSGTREPNGIWAQYKNNIENLTTTSTINASNFNVYYTYNDGTKEESSPISTSKYNASGNLFPYNFDRTYTTGDSTTAQVSVSLRDGEETNIVGDGRSAVVNIDNVRFVEPIGIAGITLPDTLVTQIARSKFDYSGITVRIRLTQSRTINVPLDAFKEHDNYKTILENTYYDSDEWDESNENDHIVSSLSLGAKFVKIKFTYPGKDSIESDLSAIDVSPIAIDTPTFTYHEKEITTQDGGKIVIMDYTKGLSVSAALPNYSQYKDNGGEPAVTFAISGGDGYTVNADGSYSFTKPGTYAITATLGSDTAANADFVWGLPLGGGDRGSDKTNSQVLTYKLKINKSKIDIETESIKDIVYTYKTTPSPKTEISAHERVSKKAIEKPFTLNSATGNIDDENYYFRYEYFDELTSDGKVPDVRSLTAPENVGHYYAVAVTKENLYYEKSVSAPIAVTVNPAEVDSKAVLQSPTYKRGESYNKDNVLVNSGIDEYGISVSKVNGSENGSVTYWKDGGYDVELTIGNKNYVWKGSGWDKATWTDQDSLEDYRKKSDAKFVINKRVITYTVTAPDFYYGEYLPSTATLVSSSENSIYVGDPAVTYSDTAQGSDLNKWNVGNYTVTYTPKYASDLSADEKNSLTLTSVSQGFSIKKAQIRAITNNTTPLTYKKEGNLVEFIDWITFKHGGSGKFDTLPEILLRTVSFQYDDGTDGTKDFKPTYSYQNLKFLTLTNAGTYTVAVSIYDKINFEWESGSQDDITLTWTVNRADVRYQFLAAGVSGEDWKDNTKQASAYYEGAETGATQPLPKFRFLDQENKALLCSYVISLNGSDGATDGTNITATGSYVFTFTLDDSVRNYKIASGYNTFTYTVNPQALDPIEATIPTSITFSGETFDFTKWVKVPDGKTYADVYGSRVAITINGDANAVLRDSGIYTVKFTPCGGFSWKDNASDPEFTVMISQLDVDLDWSGTTVTYDGNLHAPSVTFKNNKDGEQASLKITIGGEERVTNAGVYTATVSLEGDKKSNYNLTDSTNHTSFTIKKAVLASLPTVSDSAYIGADQTVDFTQAWNNSFNGLSGKVDVNVVNDVNANDYSFVNGILTYFHAGNYTVTFTLNDTAKTNFCWTADGCEKFGSDAETENTALFAVSRMQIVAPALDGYRTMQWTGGVVSPFYDGLHINEPESFATVGGGSIKLKVTTYYGEGDYNTNNQDPYSTDRKNNYFVAFGIREPGDDFVSGKTFSASDFIWTENEDDKKNSNITYVTEYGKVDESGIVVYLRYAITQKIIGVNFTFEGYVYGDNGYQADSKDGRKFTDVEIANGFSFDNLTSSAFKGLTASYDPTFATGGDGGEDAFDTIAGQHPTVKLAFYTAYTNADVNTPVTDLVNGLPWDAREEYIVVISVIFGSGSDYENFTRTVTFSVAKRTASLTWTDDGAQVTYDGTPHTRVASVNNLAQKTEGTDDVVAVTVSTVTNVLYKEGAVADQTVTASINQTNYVLNDSAKTSAVRINPKEITVNGKTIGSIYGEAPVSALTDYVDLAGGSTICDGDTFANIVTYQIKQGENVVTYTALTGVGTYAIVPKVINAEGNYVLSNDSKNGSLTVSQRVITVTVNETLATSVYGTNPLDLNDAKYYTVTAVNGVKVTGIPAGETKQVFTLSHGLNNRSSVGSHTITCTLNDTANYKLVKQDGSDGFDTFSYTITNAALTGVNVVGYNNKYDGTSHNVFDVLTAVTVDGTTEFTWEYSENGSDWETYTVTDGIANLRIRNVSESKNYYVRVSARNHDTFVWKNNGDTAAAVEVKVTPATLNVSVNLSIYFGETGPDKHGSEGKWFKQTLSDLRDVNGIFTVTGLYQIAETNDENLFRAASDGDFRYLNLDGTVNTDGAFAYSYVDAYERGDKAGKYGLQFNADGLAWGNYVFEGVQGYLTVDKLPITVAIKVATTAVYGTHPVNIKEVNRSNLAITTEAKSKYDNATAVAIDDLNVGKLVSSVETDALIVEDGVVNTNNVVAGGYDITVTVNSDNCAWETAFSAKYEITKAQNAIATENYTLFAKAEYSSADGSAIPTAWTYGNYSANHTNGYNYSGDHALKDFALIFNGTKLTVTVYLPDGTSKVKEVTDGNFKAALDGMFTELYTGRLLNAGEYRVHYGIAESTNYFGKDDYNLYFAVAKQPLSITPDNLTVVYGNDLAATGYTYNVDGLVYAGEQLDKIEDVVSFTFASTYAKGFENGSVGTYAITHTESDVKGSLYGNYEITYAEENKAVTVTPRSLTIQIETKSNNFDLQTLSGFVYGKEDKKKLTFTLADGSEIYADDLTGVTSEGLKENELDDEAQRIFTLNTNAHTPYKGTYATNSVGNYAVYLVAKDAKRAANYDITIENGSEDFSGQFAAGDNALNTNGYGTFTIVPAPINIVLGNRYGKVGETGTPEVYDNNDLNFGTYDGKYKLYLPYAERYDATIKQNVKDENIAISVRYYVGSAINESNYLGDGKLPINAGTYCFIFSSDDVNYEPSMAKQDLIIAKRGLSYSSTVNYGGDNVNVTDNKYSRFYIGRDYVWTVTFEKGNATSGLVAEEWLGLDVVFSEGTDSLDTIKQVLCTSSSNANVYQFSAKNAGVYNVTLTFNGTGTANPNNYTFESAKFTLTVTKTVLAVNVENANVQYGTAIGANGAAVTDGAITRFGGFTLRYTSADVNGDELAAILEIARQDKTLFDESGVTYGLGGYNAKTSNASTSYFVTPANLNAKNFDFSYGSTGTLTVVKREVTVKVKGIDDGNKYASSPYTGLRNHDELINNAFEAYYTEYLEEVNDVFGANTNKPYADLGITLSVKNDPIDCGKYAILPNYESANYDITFVDNSGAEITQSRKNNQNPDDDMPRYAIVKAKLTVQVNEKVLIYGNTVDLDNFTLVYSGWKGGDIGRGPDGLGTVYWNVPYKGVKVAGGNIYTPWESVAGHKFKVIPEMKDGKDGSVLDGVTNYYFDLQPVEVTVISRPISDDFIEVDHDLTYKEVSETNYEGGKFGANQDMPIIFTEYLEDLKVYAPKITYTYSYDGGTTFVSSKPNTVGKYKVKVTFNTNGTYASEYNFKFESTNDVSKVYDFEITKRDILLRWENSNSGSVKVDPSATENTVANYIADIMEVVSFNCTPAGANPYEVTAYTATNTGLTFDYGSNLGRYTLTVRFNADAKKNYKWSADGDPDTFAVYFSVVLDGTLTEIKNLTIGNDWAYGAVPGEASAELWCSGTKIDNARFAYSYIRIESFGLTDNRDITTLSGLTTIGNWMASLPNNPDAGWYVLRATYAGSADLSESVAWRVFRIEKQVVSAPSIDVNENNNVYTGQRLQAEVTYNGDAVLLTSTLDRIGTENGATLFAANADTYVITFALKDYSNYEWILTASTETENGREVVKLQWTIAKSNDVAIVWDSDEDARITFGDAWQPSAHTPFQTVQSFAYQIRGNESVPDADGEWISTRYTSAGTYWVRAICVPNSSNYENSPAVYAKLTIEKKELIAYPTASIVYGTQFTDTLTGRTFADYDFAGLVSGNNKNNITVDVNALRYELLGMTGNLHVGSGYQLMFKTEKTTVDGVERDTVIGMTSNNYYVVVNQNNAGTLSVTPKSITVRLGNSTSVYNGATPVLDNSNWRISGGTDSIAAWDAGNIADVLGITLRFVDGSVSNVNSYQVTASENSDDYAVSFINGIHTITALRVSVVLNAGGGTYGGTITGASVAEINPVNATTDIADNLEFVYRYTGISNSGASYDSNEHPVLAGIYTVSVSAIKDSVDYDRNNFELVLTEGVISAAFEVSKKQIDASKLSIPSKPYTGQKITPEIIDEFYNIDGAKVYEIVEPDKFNFVDRGTHFFNLRIVDFANYKWLSVDIAEKEVSFNIVKALNSLVSGNPNETPTIKITGWTYGQYNPTVNFPNATVKFGQDDIKFYYSAEENGVYREGLPSNENAGTYWIRVVVAETEDYSYFESAPVRVEIAKVTVNAPTLTLNDSNGTYTGENLLSVVLGYNSHIMDFDYGDREARVQGGEITLVALNAGEYKVKFIIKSTSAVNYRWADGITLDENGDVELTWTVARKKVALPSDNTDKLIVNGSILEYFPNGFDPSIMTITDNKSGYGGDFKAYVSLIDPDNYEWENGAVGPLPYPFTIIGSHTVFIIVICSISGASLIAAIVAVIQYVRYRKKNKADYPDDDGGEDGSDKTDGKADTAEVKA